jgi:hypothetical protein
VGALIAQCLWLSAPVALAGILHMVVVKLDLFRALKVPIDGGRTIGGERIFGANKTWRGFFFMVAASAALGAAQGLLWGSWALRAGAAPLDFAAIGRGLAGGYAVVGAVLGLGYALGELPNSFVKRRIAIEPGKTTRGAIGAAFLVIDQADSVVAALGLAALFFGVSWRIVVAGTVCLTLLHLAINAGLYVAGVRKNL